jgi:subtilisin family serine protease
MKPHIQLKLRHGIVLPDAPHWTAIIGDKSRATGELPPPVASVLARWALPVWVTREHTREGSSWSPAEIASGLDRMYRLVLHESRRVPPELIHDLTLIPDVEYARIGRVSVVPIPERSDAMESRAGRRARDVIGLEEAHRFSRGDRSVVVAVLDTGVDTQHRELRDAMLTGRDFVDILDGFDEFVGDFLDPDDDPGDDVGHGTHVAGIIAGQGERMPVGVAPECGILPVRVLAALRQGGRVVGAGLIDNINNGIKWAVDRGARIINMSLGVRHSGGGLPHEEVVEYALRKGATIVAAAGNDGSERLYYPGALPGVIAVGAVDEGGAVAPYSTWGAQVSFVAPGTDIYSSAPGNDYAFSTGTSHACPFVTGAAALLASYARAEGGRRLADRQVKHILKHTADRVDGSFKHRKAGFGMLNVADAMRLLRHRLN